MNTCFWYAGQQKAVFSEFLVAVKLLLKKHLDSISKQKMHALHLENYLKGLFFFSSFLQTKALTQRRSSF